MDEPRTDTSQLSLPPACRAALARCPRERSVLQHKICVDLSWWNRELDARQLPGGPVTGDHGETAGVAAVSRAFLFTLSGDVSQEGVLRLLWHVLAWGAGPYRRLCLKRLDEVKAKPESAELLQSTVAAGREDLETAYKKLMRPAGIKYLGPAFFTKLLYFAAGGGTGYGPLILDSRVARTLRWQCHWDSLEVGGGWPAYTYRRYCELLSRWAGEETAALGRQVHPDEIERCLFRLAG